MSAPRLTFLYPHLFRRPLAATGRVSRGLRATRQQCPQEPTCSRPLSSTAQKLYDTQPIGSYNPPDRAIPLPQPGDNRSQSSSENRDDKSAEGRRDGDQDKDRIGRENGDEDDVIDVSPRSTQPEMDARESHPAEPVPEMSLQLTRPLERVLHMDPPMSRGDRDGDETRPHMKAPPYVHHFDTYSLVHDLQTGGFSQQQSISLMKAVRGLLANNMQMARDELVSRSDTENAGYLFRAACSELKTEVQNGRRAAAEKSRSERAHLQHEVDILGQRVAQETATLKEELKGVFDDRKMAVRMEQREMESQIQELNYKIQSVLAGTAKGEVEGLRWFLTRRAAIFIGGLAVAVVIGIQYSVHSSNTRKEERKKLKAVEDSSAGEPTGTAYTSAPRNAQTSESTDALLASMDTKTSQSYVSLG